MAPFSIILVGEFCVTIYNNCRIKVSEVQHLAPIGVRCDVLFF